MGLYSNHIFPRILDWSLGTPLVRRERRAALAGAFGDVLEVGFGTGLNLSSYPTEVTQLTALDSERMLPERVAGRIAEAHMPVKQVQFDANASLPFEDESFDCVVTTFTLCSIRDVKAALEAIRRVLKADGRYLFLEHGLSAERAVAKWQDRLNPLQKVVARGCNINRRIDRLISDAGYDIQELNRFQMPKTPPVFAEMYRGIAKKSA